MVDVCSLYWIRLPLHSDISAEGYVGITTSKPQKRFREHAHAARHASAYPVHAAIRKYGAELVMEVVSTGSLAECIERERELRPTARIGWNIIPGGDVPPMLGRRHSEETLDKLRLASRARPQHVVEKCKETLIRSGPRSEVGSRNIRERKRATGGWRLHWANKPLWALASEIYEASVQHPSAGYGRLARLVGIPAKAGSIVNIVNKIKNTNWIPLNDPEWVAWRQEYTIEGL